MRGNELIIFLLFGIGWIIFFNFWFGIWKKQRLKIKRENISINFFLSYQKVVSILLFFASSYSFYNVFLNKIIKEQLAAPNGYFTLFLMSIGYFLPLFILGLLIPKIYDYYAHGISGMIVYAGVASLIFLFITRQGFSSIDDSMSQLIGLYQFFLAVFLPFDIGEKLSIVFGDRIAFLNKFREGYKLK